MKVIAKKDRKLLLINTGNTQNENKAETIELTVPEEYEDYNKKIVFITPDETVWDVITNNTYKITNAITKYKQVDFYIWLTKDDVDFRSKTMPLRFYHNEDASDEITPEEISGVNTVVNILEEEITKVDSLETELRALITDIQNKLDNGEFDGEDGYTPQKGIDYFTEQDIEEIETDVKNDLEENVLVNYSLTAETGSKIELSINTTDYKLKAILKDKNNNIIHTSNVIDLPLETMVVNATYDKVNKAIILTLQNGTTVSISVADLVSGLVSESQLQTILSNYYTKTEINTLLNNKVDKVQGKELSSNDFTDVLKEKLEGLENYDDTEIKADIEKLQTENARLKATLQTTTGEGKEVTLDKTAELEFIKPPLPRGNSEQESTTGKNLFKPIPSATRNGITFTNNGDGSYTLNGTATAPTSFYIVNVGYGSGTYALSANNPVTNSGVILQLETSNGNKNTALNAINKTLIDNCDDINVLTVIVSNGTTLSNFVIKPQLELGSSVTDFEPYTGGTASPNPDYPQEITNVTGDVEVKVQNKNIVKINNVSETSINGMVYSIENGVLKINGTANKGTTIVLANNIFFKKGTYTHSINDIKSAMFFSFDNLSNTMLRVISGTKIKNITFQLAEDTIFERYILWVDNGTSFNNEKFYLQTEPNTTSTPYTPHKEQVLPLTLGNIELCKIGDYQDYFYKESNKWYLHKEIAKKVLDGSENWNLNSNVSTDNFKVFYLYNAGMLEKANILCDKFKYINSRGAANCIWTPYSTEIDISISSLFVSTSQEFKTWLSTNNILLYYPLKTPTDTEITDTTLISQLEAINNAISYEEQTNISSNTIALFNVEAYQSTKLVLEERDAKYESLEARVALLE